MQTPESNRAFSSKLADAEGWHLFLINKILPITTCVVLINIPKGFSTSLAPPFHTAESWNHEAKIKLVIGS